MTNSRFISTAFPCALVVVSLAMCGCTSMSGTTNKWATAWRKSTEPKPVDPNHEETVTYWGQKKKEPKPPTVSPELKERMAKKTDESQRARDYADNFKAGNLRLKEGKLDEARRAYELALAAKPDDPDVHHRLAVVADKQQLFGVADDHYEAALRKRPRDPNLLSDIGYSHALRNDDRGAERTLREALAIDPSHRGAMLNLGTLYGKQGRYDDALALFRRGTTEAETQQYLAQLFPQGPPSALALASNRAEAGQRTVLPIPTDERTDVRNMTLEQLKSEMERRLSEGNQNRQPQFAPSPSQRDWAGDSSMPDQRAVPDQRPNIAPNNPAWAPGQPSDNSTTNPPPTVYPGAGQFPPYSPPLQPGATITLPPNLQPGTAMQPYPGRASNDATQRPGFAPARSQSPLMAPPGTRPDSNIDFWQGASAPPNTGAFNPTPSQFQSPIEQMGHAQGGADSGVSASQAAAQLGMSVGPGSLFPIVASDPTSAGGTSMPSSGAPAYEQRSGNEFAQPPQYQNQNNQPSPNGAPYQGRLQLPVNDGSAASQFSPHWQGANSSKSAGTAQQGSAGSEMSIAPNSPASNMSRPWDAPANGQQPTSNTGSGVIQAGGLSNWGQSATRTNDSLETFPSDTSGGGTSRYAKTPWADPTSQPGGSRPYSGAWPNSNSLPNGAASGSGSSPNSLPMWNSGNGAGASLPGGAGPATGSSANGTPPQWPYSSQR